MENDQFGGRTDDDLFADDFEPVAPEDQIPIITPAAPETPPTEPIASKGEANPSEPDPPASVTPPSQTPISLAQSRHNRPEKGPRSNNHHNNNGQKSKPPKSSPPAESTTLPAASAPPPTAPKGPAASTVSPASTKFQSLNTASAVSEARLGSGANPRTKMTEDELAAKMDKMRILNAEKQRRFQQAQADESAHAEALARSQEEMAKRRAEEAAKRRAAEEDRKRLEEERAKNRERKLNAMGQKEGGWDEGKEERQAEEDRQGFRSAYGGVRGSREGGLAGSRFADHDAGDDGYGYGSRGRGGRGRGGRGGGRGRGGRLFDTGGDREYEAQDRNGGFLANESWAARRDKEKQNKPSLKQEDFPALPSTKKTTAPASAKKLDTTTTAAAVLAADIPLSPPIGKWDEEVAAMDARTTS